MLRPLRQAIILKNQTTTSHTWVMNVPFLAVWPPQPKTAYRFDIRPYGVYAPDEISSPFLVRILTITISTLECYGCRRERHKSIFRVEKYMILSKQPLFLSIHIASLYVDLIFANNYLNCILLSLCYGLYGKPSYLKIKPLLLIHEWWMSRF